MRTAALLLSLLTAWPLTAAAWSLDIAGGGRRLYLHVGNGVAGGNLATVNLVSVSVPATQLGAGPLVMGTDSTQSASLSGVVSRVVCPTPSQQLHIGASYRRNGGPPGDATLSVTAPAVLTNARGETLPINLISWTASAPGSPVPNVIPGGTFQGGTQFLAAVPRNKYLETCHTFQYANNLRPPEGSYTAQVTYTLSSP